MNWPLPDLDRPYPVSPEQSAQFQEDGYAVLHDVCSPGELAPYAEAIRNLAMAKSVGVKPLAERDTYGKAFLQIINLWQMDETVAKFVLAKRFGQIAADLMGVPAVRLYHDQALFKEPGGGPTPWHQDQFYWPLDGVKTVTMWMPLVHISADMMAMKFARGSHKTGPLVMKEISDESDRAIAMHIAEQKLTIHQVQELAPGDATFHSGWTLHGAPGNSTDRCRDVMTIIFYEDGAVISEPDSDFRRNDMQGFFPGQMPGEKAASPLNPVVFSRE